VTGHVPPEIVIAFWGRCESYHIPKDLALQEAMELWMKKPLPRKKATPQQKPNGGAYKDTVKARKRRKKPTKPSNVEKRRQIIQQHETAAKQS